MIIDTAFWLCTWSFRLRPSAMVRASVPYGISRLDCSFHAVDQAIAAKKLPFARYGASGRRCVAARAGAREGGSGGQHDRIPQVEKRCVEVVMMTAAAAAAKECKSLRERPLTKCSPNQENRNHAECDVCVLQRYTCQIFTAFLAVPCVPQTTSSRQTGAAKKQQNKQLGRLALIEDVKRCCIMPIPCRCPRCCYRPRVHKTSTNVHLVQNRNAAGSCSGVSVQGSLRAWLLRRRFSGLQLPSDPVSRRLRMPLPGVRV